ncbi:MAG: DNA mismatch repair protein MutS [Planctomycetes bacterium]|nr:DNA mismatch repair protein MutS [Planctomycetota bacterium]
MPTPLMEQYAAIKRQHPGEILLFRLGDFYEMFYDDAKTASTILGIVLTSRSKGDDRVPMCGIPYHSSQSYIGRLLKAGHRVAICEQTQDPEEADGLVDRAVVRVITPGTLVEEPILDEKRNNYLAAVTRDGGLAWVDTSTGRFLLEDVAPAHLLDELARLSPAETLVAGEGDVERIRAASGGIVTTWHEWAFEPGASRRDLAAHFEVANLAGFGCEELGPAVGAAGAILAYLKETQRGPLKHIVRLEKHTAAGRLFLDRQTQSALELTETQRAGERAGSLLWVLDRTMTPMGARLLRDWVTGPLADAAAIRARQDEVAAFVEHRFRRIDLQAALKPICDIERVLARVGAGRAHPRDLVGLRQSVAALPKLAEVSGRRFADHSALGDVLARAIVDEPPHLLTEGGIIRKGFDEELDKLRSISYDGKAWLAAFEKREAERTGIGSLKVGYHRVFGYFIEVTNVHREKIPTDYVRKQTLKDAERFITPELKDYETQVLNADERARKLEQELFRRVRDRVAEHIAPLQETARAVAELDALASLAQVAEEHDYVRPVVDESNVLEVRDGRHPVLERLKQEKFVPNDVGVGGDARVLLITGPNMAGKSTYIRQAALIALLAQMGSFVPAKSARVGRVDRIFTRVGASDELTRNASTFMVEMNETANILNHATARSLVILDEIGRGTSTFDGLSIAWAVTEHLHDRIGARTLFATHYHELTELGRVLPGVKNLHVEVKEWGESVVFLHRIVEGPTDKSYGIHVARLAGIPREVVERAKVILAGLEALTLDEKDRPRMARKPRAGEMEQLSLFADMVRARPAGKPSPVVAELARLDPHQMTPIEALAKLAELAAKARAQ